MQTTIRRTVAFVLAVLGTATLISCTSGSGPSGGAPAGDSGGLVNQVLAGSSDLASALDVVPDVPDANVMFTDWSMLGHQDPKGPNAAPFAVELLEFDGEMQRDLGIRSASADWEIDMWRTGHPLTIVLRFNRNTDLAGVAAKLTRFGYHANESIFSGGQPDQRRMWTFPMRNIGIAAGRQLLVAGPNATEVRSILAGSASPLGHASSVTPLIGLAAAKLGRIATASIAVGQPACVTLTAILGLNATRAQVDYLRKYFTGTFTRPQAEITALDGSAPTTAIDALTFPDQGTAQANKKSRTAAGGVLSKASGIHVTGAAVTGRVLSFTLAAGQPHDVVQAVLSRELGVDFCK